MAYPRTAVIVGVDESDELGATPNKSPLMHHAEAARNALANAGLGFDDVDGLFSCMTNGSLTSVTQVAEYLGLAPRYADGTQVGGSSFEFFIEHAAAAIEAGLCEVALITHGETGRSIWREGWARGGGGGNGTIPGSQFETPYGIGGAPSAYAIAAQRHMAQYGTTSEDLARIAVSTRRWAQMNPKALMRDPITVQDVVESRLIAYPFHLLDCCLLTDGGGAIVLTSEDRARDLPRKAVRILGSGTALTHTGTSAMPDLTVTPAAISGPLAMQRAGVSHDDIDVLELYDSFTYTALVTLESLGFCKPGEGKDLIADDRIAPGGALPMNTNGGGLSYTHSGMYGMFIMIEAVRQLRGELLDGCPNGEQGEHTYDHRRGCRAVRDAQIALVNGTGGTLSSCGTVILGVD